jgi:hypothetical protein
MPLLVPACANEIYSEMVAAKLVNPTLSYASGYYSAMSNAVITNILASSIVTGVCPPSGPISGAMVITPALTFDPLIYSNLLSAGIVNPALTNANSMATAFGTAFKLSMDSAIVDGVCAAGIFTGTISFPSGSFFNNMYNQLSSAKLINAADSSSNNMCKAFGNALQKYITTNAVLVGTYPFPAGGPLAGGKVT